MPNPLSKKPEKLGHVTVSYHPASSILTRPSGFIDTFDFTLNPYSGCGFGCTYCYAAFFAKTDQLKADWGKWLNVKENALALLVKKRRRPLIGSTIYMSSVTDPYQPIEKDLELTRSILVELLNYHKVRLIVQTRGPLVVRDIDLLRQFEYAQVNMTITTDDEEVRRVFEPYCASVSRRLAAIRAVQAAGIETCISMTPLLPVSAPETFAKQLKATGVPRFVTQYFHTTRSRFAAGTSDEAQAISKQLGWTRTRYDEVVSIFRQHLPEVREGKAGFTPYWLETDRTGDVSHKPTSMRDERPPEG